MAFSRRYRRSYFSHLYGRISCEPPEASALNVGASYQKNHVSFIQTQSGFESGHQTSPGLRRASLSLFERAQTGSQVIPLSSLGQWSVCYEIWYWVPFNTERWGLFVRTKWSLSAPGGWCIERWSVTSAWDGALTTLPAVQQRGAQKKAAHYHLTAN